MKLVVMIVTKDVPEHTQEQRVKHLHLTRRTWLAVIWAKLMERKGVMNKRKELVMDMEMASIMKVRKVQKFSW